MARPDPRREISDVKRKFLELQEYLEVLNQLERVPKCKLSDALREEIESLLNPSDVKRDKNVLCSSGRDDTSCEVETSHPQKASYEESYDDHEVGNHRWPLWLKVLMLIVSTIFIGSCVSQCRSH